MKNLFILTVFILITLSSSAQNTHALRDENGCHVIGRGFVIVTNDSYFTADDYTRMSRLGANYQVVRLELGKLSNFPDSQLDPNYLLKLDSLVQLGKNAGIQTVFKMTMYGVESFLWEEFWVNKNNMHKTYMDAWKVIWNRYKNEKAVKGYDIVNEPRKLTMNISYQDLTDKYIKLIDEKLATKEAEILTI